MKRILLFLTCILTLFGIARAEDELVQDCTFIGSNFSANNSSYTSGTFTYSYSNGFVLKFTNCNNNNKGWDFVKIGQKSNTNNTATISTEKAFSEEISKIVVNVQKNVASAVVSITLKSSTNGSTWSDISGVAPVTVNGTSIQDITFELTPTANLYYQLSFNSNNSTTTNGALSINGIKFYKNVPIIENDPRTPVTLTFSPSEATEEINSEYSLPAPTAIADGKDITNEVSPYIIYSIDPVDSPLASVSQDSKNVTFTLKSVGNVVITAKLADNDLYVLSGSAPTFTLNVFDPNTPTYDLVTDVADLGEPAECVIAYTAGNVAMGAQNGTSRGYVSATIANGVLEYADGMAVVTVAKTDKSDKNGNPYYTLAVDDGYLSAATSGNTLNTATILGDACYATISIGEDGNATIQFNSSNDANILQYNISSPRFSCYNNTQKTVQLYMNTAGLDPKPSLSFLYNGETVSGPVEVNWNATEFPTLQKPDEITDVTYSSSNSEVAEVNKTTGAITLKGIAGEAIITATTAPIEGMYAAGSESYTLVVTDPNAKTVTFDFTTKDPYVMTSTNDGETYYNDEISFDENDVTMTVTGKYRSWAGKNSYDFRIYKDENSAIKISAPLGYIIEKIEFDGSSLNNLKSDNGTYDDNNGLWVSNVGDTDYDVVFTPTGTTNINTIKVYYTAGPNFYLVGTMTNNESGNPSYLFTNNFDGTYSLEVAVINAYNGGKEQFVIADSNSSVVYTGPSNGDIDMENGKYSDLKQWGSGVDYYMGLATTLYNVTLTLDPHENTLTINGTEIENKLVLTPGSDKTEQSGTITGTNIVMNTNNEGVLVFVYSPDNAQVYYAITLNEKNSVRAIDEDATLDWKTAQTSDYDADAYQIPLGVETSGTLYIKYGESLDSASDPAEYTFQVNKSTPTGVDAIAPAEGKAEAEYYTLQGVRVQNPDKGIYIVKKGGKTAKVVL